MFNNAQVGLQALILVVMVFGWLSLFTNLIPGLVIIWLAALVYGLVGGFTLARGILFALMTLLMIGGSIIDEFVMGASARKTGASWLSVVAATIAGIAGSLTFPPFGGLIAALLVLFGIEYLRVRDWRKAFASARGMAFGCGWSVVIRLIIGIVMIGIFLGWVYYT